MPFTGCEIDVCTRLRSAVLRNNLPIVRMIVRHNPAIIQNPDYLDKSNTSLHLACQHGFLDLAKYLVDAGHEETGVSRNTDRDTPLMAAARGNQVEVARYLMERFPYSVPYKNNAGMDLVMISAQGGAVALLPSLLTQDPMIPLDAVDNEGNTALHYAATEGNLGIIQILLDHGASASIKNKAQWTPIQYSSTMVVELYFTKMVVIAEKRQMDERKRKEKEDESGQASVGGIRIISPDDNIPFPSFPDAGPDDGFEASLWKTNSSRQTTPWRAPTDHAQNKEVSPASSPDGPSQMFFP